MVSEVRELHFGTAGIPNSTPRKSTIDGIRRVFELGLNAMEIEFVRGIRMGLEYAREVKGIALELGVLLTVHAPYYINLNSSEEAKVKASISRILESARIGYEAGAWSVVFHAGYYGELSSEATYNNVKKSLTSIVKTLNDEGIDIWVRPEVMGGLSEFGSLEEIVRISEEIGDRVLPCIDFAHLHARTIGRYNTYDEFRNVLEYVERVLGRVALDNMHIHFSGIEYGQRGEIRHVNVSESDFNYKDLARVLSEFNVKGVIISESPNLEEDAMIMKKVYESFSKKTKHSL